MRSEQEINAMIARLENLIQQKEHDLHYGSEPLKVLGDAGRQMLEELIYNCKQEICLLKWVLEPEGNGE